MIKSYIVCDNCGAEGTERAEQRRVPMHGPTLDGWMTAEVAIELPPTDAEIAALETRKRRAQVYMDRATEEKRVDPADLGGFVQDAGSLLGMEVQHRVRHAHLHICPACVAGPMAAFATLAKDCAARHGNDEYGLFGGPVVAGFDPSDAA
jgi:hypothetical protein